MNISEAAKVSGLPVKTLRYYETIGLVVPVRQQSNEYRAYLPNDIERLVLLRRARSAGFTLPECRELLAHVEQLGPNMEAFLVPKMASLALQQQELQLLREQLGQLLLQSVPVGRTDDRQQSQRPMSFMLVEPQ